MRAAKTLSIGLLMLIAVPATAAAGPDLEGRWRVEGHTERGAPYGGSVTITERGGVLEVRLEAGHPDLSGTWEGSGFVDEAGELRFALRRDRAAHGATDSLAAARDGGELEELSDQPVLVGTFATAGDDRLEGRTVLSRPHQRTSPLGAETLVLVARPRRPEPAAEAEGRRQDRAAERERGREDEDDDDGAIGRVREFGRHLIALARAELREEAIEGEVLEHEFDVSEFAHLGIGIGLRYVPPEALNAEQRAADAARRAETGRPTFWAGTSIEGGPRVPLNANVTLGEVAARVGFEAAARLRYEVVDIYDLPEGITDVNRALAQLRQARKRTFDLPLTAADARAMTLGAERVIEGEGTIALRGSISVGTDLGDLGEVSHIGASARVGGFWRIKGHVKLKVVRLSDDMVAIRVTRGRERARGGSADFFVGLFVDRDALADQIEPSVEFFDPLHERVAEELADEVADEAEDVVRFQIAFGAEATRRSQVDVTYRFRLDDPDAVRAFERAVRGDLTVAGDLAGEGPDAAVVEELRILLEEERHHRFGELNVSVIRAGRSRTATATDLQIDQEGQGRRNFNVFRYERRRRGLLGGETMLELELIRADREGADLPDGARERAFRFHLRTDDEHSTQGDVERFLDQIERFGLPGAERADEIREARPDRNVFELIGGGRFNDTTRELWVEMSDEGIRDVMDSTDEEVLAAYARGYSLVEGKIPVFSTPEGREQLEELARDARFGDDIGRTAEEQIDAWEQAQSFVKDLRRLRDARDDEQRAERLTRLADHNRYRLYGLAAIAELAPRETISARASLRGNLLPFAMEAGFTGDRFHPTRVEIPEGR